MNLYLIRHAQTTMNSLGKVFSGSTDVPLSEDGIKQTCTTANNPLWSTIDKVYITSLIRTKQTADILFPTHVPQIIIPEFSEVDFGDYEGQLMTPENQNDPIFYKWVNDPENLTFPNGENLLIHNQKAYLALKEIIDKSTEQNIAIISHATTIRLLLSYIITGNIKFFRNIPCDNGSVSMLKVDDTKINVKYINAPL